MRSASLTINETQCADALHDYDILDTPPEANFEDLTDLAENICKTSVAFISLINRNCQWFISKVGLDVAETPLYNGLT